MKDPAFLFYSQDFIVGTNTMNFEDRGKYITILAQMHQQGRMDEETIRFLVGNVSDKLKCKFKIDENGFWYNERLEIEIEKRNTFVGSRRENGKLGGRPKKPKGYPKGKPNGKPNENLPEDEIEDEIEIKKRKRKPFVKPTIEEVRQFFKENGYNPDIGEDKWNYYNDADWFDSKGNPVLNWKQKMRSVWFKDEYKIKENSIPFYPDLNKKYGI